jgi:type II pantothenate kinase
MIIGIDIGGSTTKIVGIKDKTIIEPLTVEANDPIASASGALGKFISVNKISLKDIQKVITTGVGASFLDDDLLGLQVSKIEEFRALGYGGLLLSGLKKAIVASLGTGTAFVKAHGRCIHHLGGTGVGGGTILGLSKQMAHLSTFENIVEMASSGNLTNVDLTIGDISHATISHLPSSITASNFGKMNDQVGRNDICKGILNMVFQVVGMMAIFAARTERDKDIIMAGKMVHVPQAQKTFSELGKLYNVSFHIPKHAEYSTAIGAAISKSPQDFID